MSSIVNDTQQLISDLKSHIIQEYAQDPWLLVNRDSYLFYRNYALSQNKPSQPTSTSTPTLSNNIPLKKELVKPQEMPADPILSQETKPKEIPQAVTPKESAIPPSTKSLPVEKVPVTKTIEMEQLKPVANNDFSDIKKIIQEKFPEQVLLAKAPDDSLAKTIKNAWQTVKVETNFYLVISDVKPHQKKLLQNIVFAIETILGQCVEVVQKRTMGQISGKGLELPDLELFLNAPAQKAALWKEINRINKI